MWHWRDPSRATEQFYTESTPFDVAKITDPSSQEYKAMIRDIDSVSACLKKLQSLNIPVLWRPLHEASGSWFWWGAKEAGPCKQLWKVMYERMTFHHGLDNLLWVWTTDNAADAGDWYPGDDTVDILAMDIYAGNGQHGSQYVAFDKAREQSGARKMIALAECGPVPHPDLMAGYGDLWSWFMPWNGPMTRDHAVNGAVYLRSVLDNDNVITRENMPSLH